MNTRNLNRKLFYFDEIQDALDEIHEARSDTRNKTNARRHRVDDKDESDDSNATLPGCSRYARFETNARRHWVDDEDETDDSNATLLGCSRYARIKTNARRHWVDDEDEYDGSNYTTMPTCSYAISKTNSRRHCSNKSNDRHWVDEDESDDSNATLPTRTRYARNLTEDQLFSSLLSRENMNYKREDSYEINVTNNETEKEPDSEKAIKAIEEIRDSWDYVILEARCNYSEMYSRLSIPISNALQWELRRHKEKFAVYDARMREWLVKPSEAVEPEYEYCYNGTEFINFKIGKSFHSTTANSLLLVGKYTILMQEGNLLSVTSRAPELCGDFLLPEVRLIVGVPGCGKTKYILNRHCEGSLVLTSCAEGAFDIRVRMNQMNPYIERDTLRKNYRTIDSYLLNSREAYSSVWVDEALMEHPGKLFLVCLFSHCRAMYLLGDPNQLGYINRVHDYKLLYDKPLTFFKPAKTLNISYRCPVDVMAVLSSKYDGGAFSASDCIRSMECHSFTRLECVPYYPGVKYLVFKQAEKHKMLKAGYDVSTIHEFQGKEADNVIVVRTSRNLDEQLYKSVPHMVVAITRHKVSLSYYTPVNDDLKKLIETPLTTNDLNKVKRQNSTWMVEY